MKRSLGLIAAFVMLLALASACTPTTPTPTPTPMNTVKPVETPITTSEPVSGTDPAVSGTDTQNMPAEIQGFVEGQVIDPETAPEDLIKAIEEKYPGAKEKIKSITYERYMDSQVYHVILNGTDNNMAEQFYVKADYEIIPYDTATPAGELTTPGND